jgi:hypothetical protein
MALLLGPIEAPMEAARRSRCRLAFVTGSSTLNRDWLNRRSAAGSSAMA